jgi:hypothetical protein
LVFYPHCTSAAGEIPQSKTGIEVPPEWVLSFDAKRQKSLIEPRFCKAQGKGWAPKMQTMRDLKWFE